MRISEIYQSRYLKAADLGGRTVTVTIAHVDIEDVSGDGERKPVVYFVNKERGLVANKTNALALADAYGDETDKWRGGEVELFTIKATFGGKPVDSLRVRPLRKPDTPAGELPADDIPW